MKKITQEDIDNTNDKYEFGKCSKCGGRYVWRTYAVDDGHGCIDFETDEYCEDCGLSEGGYEEEIETDTEYGKARVSDHNTMKSKIL